jgi:pilus assembly protein CpaB
MKKRKKGPLIVVIVISLFAAFGFNSYIKKIKEQAQKDIITGATPAAGTVTPAAPTDALKVWTAKINIPVNVLVEPNMLDLKDFPRSVLKEGYYTKEQINEIVGKVAKFNLFAGDLVIADKLAKMVDASSLSHNIPQGFRALTIELDKVKSIAGFLNQGDFVDVVASVRIGNSMVTKTILQNVAVLAVDRNFSREPQFVVDPKTQQKTVATNAEPKLVTLAVPLWAVEKILAIEKSGLGKEGFRLVMKSYKDSPREDDQGKPIEGSMEQTTGFSETELFNFNNPEGAQVVSLDEKKVEGVNSTLDKTVVRIHQNSGMQKVVLNE